eukprot:TRINITY_DN16880_c0_g1_i2.p1 TRINITY_DN16880_c0_g1~~TRINITY_DN16880_c0_g1_i2.p1  ORF type:complete len:359 (-),score=43.06 TRINITY_DN16880_c0_g1_i2:562-1638(-)
MYPTSLGKVQHHYDQSYEYEQGGFLDWLAWKHDDLHRRWHFNLPLCGDPYDVHPVHGHETHEAYMFDEQHTYDYGPECCCVSSHDAYNYEYDDMHDLEIVDINNTFFVNCILHPEDVESYNDHLNRKAGKGTAFGGSTEPLSAAAAAELRHTVGMALRKTLAMDVATATVEDVDLPSLADGLLPGQNTKYETMLVYKVVLHDKHTMKKPVCGCMQPQIEHDIVLAEEARRSSRTVPSTLGIVLRRDHGLIIKTDGADVHKEYNALLAHGFPAFSVEQLAMKHSFGTGATMGQHTATHPSLVAMPPLPSKESHAVSLSGASTASPTSFRSFASRDLSERSHGAFSAQPDVSGRSHGVFA